MPPPPVTPQSLFEVFYLDYGNQEKVPLEKLRRIPPHLATSPDPQALLCQLALVQVPSLEEDFGLEAAHFLAEATLGRCFLARVEEREVSPLGGKVKGQGTGPLLKVTLVEVPSGGGSSSSHQVEGGGEGGSENPPTPPPAPSGPPSKPLSVNALILQEGLARLAKRERRLPAEKKKALDNLAQHQEVARKERLNMWQYGDIDGDEEDDLGGKKGGKGGR